MEIVTLDDFGKTIEPYLEDLRLRLVQVDGKHSDQIEFLNKRIGRLEERIMKLESKAKRGA